MAQSKPVLVQYTKGPRKGEEYVVSSPAKAKKVHPDARIIQYEDGTKYTESKAETPKSGDQKAEG